MSNQIRICSAWFWRLGCIIFASANIFHSGPATAQYLIDVGDVVEIAISGPMEIRQRVAVQMDGTIALPLMGSVAVGGLRSVDVRTKVQAAIMSRPFRRRLPDGAESIVLIEPDEITANIVEYRPIYTSGDVARPGEQVYRPMMTARQAVANAGGFESAHGRSNRAFDAADLQGEQEAVSLEIVKERVRMSRLRAELDNKDKFEPDPLLATELPGTRASLAEVLKSEQELLKARRNDSLREKEYLQSAIAKAEQHIAALNEQRTRGEQAEAANLRDLDRLNDLLKRGSVSNLRVSDARQAVMQASTRNVELNTQLLQVRRLQDDNKRALERHDDQRRIAVLQEFEDNGVKVRVLQAKLQSINQKIQYVSRVAPPGTSENSTTVRIDIIRKVGRGRERLAASEDSELWPGDVVDVVAQPAAAPPPLTR